jgi:hypothetical protein
MGIFFSCKKKLKKERKRKEKEYKYAYYSNDGSAQYYNNEYYNNSIKNGNKPLPSKNKFSTKTKKFVHFPPAI